MERHYVVAAIVSLLLLLDVTVVIKFLNNGKHMKFCYLNEDSEDLKPYADMVKVLAEGYEAWLFS